MSGLTDAEIEALLDAVGYRCHHTGPVDHTLPTGCRHCHVIVTVDIQPVAEQIVARHVAAALNEAADLIDRTCRDWEPWSDGRNRTPEVIAAVAAFQQTTYDIRILAPPTNPAARADRPVGPP